MQDYPKGMPCWAPGAAEYLESILTGEEIGFEWGGGASSVWLAPKIDRLMVMETSREWADKILRDVENENLGFGLWVRNFNDPGYIDTAGKCKPRPNLWLIDGYRRIDCLAKIEEIAWEGDIVVLDDAQDYARHLIGDQYFQAFTMPHPHAGKPCVSEKNTRDRNTELKVHAETKDTWICKWSV